MVISARGNSMKKLAAVFTAVVLLAACSAAFADTLEGDLKPFLGEPKFEMQPISKDYGRQANGVVALDGTVLMTWLKPGRNVFKSNDGKTVRACRSEDGGKTWGEEIVIASPPFATYTLIAPIMDATLVMVPAIDYRHDLEAMAAATTDRTKLVFISNPYNPTGRCLLSRDPFNTIECLVRTQNEGIAGYGG